MPREVTCPQCRSAQGAPQLDADDDSWPCPNCGYPIPAPGSPSKRHGRLSSIDLSANPITCTDEYTVPTGESPKPFTADFNLSALPTGDLDLADDDDRSFPPAREGSEGSRPDDPQDGDLSERGPARSRKPGTPARFDSDEFSSWAAQNGRGRSGQLQPTPAEALGAALRLVRVAITQTPQHLALLGGLTAVAVVALLVVAAGGNHDVMFAADTLPLTVGPSEDPKIFPQVGIIERGETVEVLDEVKNFLLVRDPAGRVGYISSEKLLSRSPPVSPELAFTRCQRRPDEVDSRSCHERARQQRDSCIEQCQGDEARDHCVSRCRERCDECILTCAGIVQAPATASERGSPQTPAAPAAGASRSAGNRRAVQGQGRSKRRRPAKRRAKSKKKRR